MHKYIFKRIFNPRKILSNCNKQPVILSLGYNYTCMGTIVDVIAGNIRRLRELKGLSQKEVAAASGVPQGQYSRIENARVEPAVSTLEKLAKVFEVSIAEFFKIYDTEEAVNLPLMEKIKLIDTLGQEEQQALFKMIDLAISNKKMKDNLQSLIAS